MDIKSKNNLKFNFYFVVLSEFEVRITGLVLVLLSYTHAHKALWTTTKKTNL